MVEHPVRIFAPEVPGSLFSSSASGVDLKDNIKSSTNKNDKLSDSAPAWEQAKEDNNQEDEDCFKASASCNDPENCQELRTKNSTLMKRLTLIEVQHAERVNNLEKKLQQAIDTHTEIEQHLKSQLQNCSEQLKSSALHLTLPHSVTTTILTMT
ncbi:hypothetical protein BBO99_00001251 [Phytophthora kernoviae]|uniref:Uncharacterized protein n=2 Tax=Phytophthora kernoviae TaxID=325452 RepID=A0A3R7K4P3_9STRA|nr:hypothetical protein G195_005343 [Phytophthora kernoviae 00238/432]KAG2525223.1 hypothetical protein JM16_004536 [Phytophthora kernoviae]KAG2526863.1 hypothetical protein JM18_004112 [Phytophthora kernoviae]RLN14859.1 hypothetical protein BBI17_004658 [Phytophthora kernoviae]RLN84583.1 hypothetical protein BBO99_00001251 [Phytophthora kernoviae]